MIAAPKELNDVIPASAILIGVRGEALRRLAEREGAKENGPLAGAVSSCGVLN